MIHHPVGSTFPSEVGSLLETDSTLYHSHGRRDALRGPKDEKGLYGYGDDDQPEPELRARVLAIGQRDIWPERFGRDVEDFG